MYVPVCRPNRQRFLCATKDFNFDSPEIQDKDIHCSYCYKTFLTGYSKKRHTYRCLVRAKLYPKDFAKDFEEYEKGESNQQYNIFYSKISNIIHYIIGKWLIFYSPCFPSTTYSSDGEEEDNMPEIRMFFLRTGVFHRIQ